MDASPSPTAQLPSESGDTPDGDSRRRPSRELAFLILVVAVLVVWVHWPALSGRTLFFDDAQYLTENPVVQNPSWASAKRFLTEVSHPSTVRGYYQPLAMISLMVDVAMGGDPDHLAPFHRTSLALHVANTALVIVLIYMVFGQPWVAALLGLLFGLHPMTVEPVTWVSERKTTLSAFFALLSLVCFIRHARRPAWRWYAGCAAAYVLALMAKPTATTLPVALLLMDYWPLRRLSVRSALEKIPLFAITAVSAVVTVISQGRAASVQMPSQFDTAARIPLTLCHNVVFYLRKIVWPTDMSAFYPVPDPMALSEPMVLAGVIGTCLLTPALLISWRWTRAVLTGWLIYFVLIFPTLGLIGFTQMIAADKYAYLPAFGLLLILAWALMPLWRRVFGEALISGGQAGIVAVVLLLAALEVSATRGYLAHWRDKEALFRHMLSLTPRQPALHVGLGNALADQDRLDEAIRHFMQALRLEPHGSVPRNNLAAALAKQGKTAAAIKHYRLALRLDPNSAQTHYNLGALLVTQGELAPAVEHLSETLRLQPDLAKAHYNLALALSKQGKLDEAVQHHTECLRQIPDFAPGHNNLAIVLIRQGRVDQAVEHLRQAVRFDPGLAHAHRNLALALTQAGKLDEAAEACRQWIRVLPGSAEAHYRLGAVLHRQGPGQDAAAEYGKALQLDPDHAQARQALGGP